MKKLRTIICLLIFVLTLPGVLALRSRLPEDVQPLIEKKYGGWSGVLRLWVCTDQPVAAWLNPCVASYEKQHPGVYLQPEVVAADALSAEGMPPPDLILFPPGQADVNLFAPLGFEPHLREGMSRNECAVPVLMGGYMWVYNAALIDRLPDTWRGLRLAVPEARAAALLALCSSKYSEGAVHTEPSGAIELGLLPDDSENTTTPAPAEGSLNCELPEDFAFDGDAWHSFINGQAAAMPVTAREIRRLEALSDQGQGPDWRLGAAGAAVYTDQVLYIGAVAQENAEQLALCRGFIEHLLSEACQGMLHRVDAFSASGADSGYAPGDSLVAMEAMLRQRPVIVPGPFDRTWRADIVAIVREYVEDRGEPQALLGRLRERLTQKTEHSG